MHRHILLYSLLILQTVRPELVEGSPRSVNLSVVALAKTEGSFRSANQTLTPVMPIAKIPVTPFSSGWISVSAPEGITIVHKETKNKKLVTTQPIQITNTGYLVTFNGKACTHGTWYLLSKNNELTINGKKYPGPATLKITPQLILLKSSIATPDMLQMTWGYSQKKETIQKSPIVKVAIHELFNNKEQPITISYDNNTLSLVHHKNKLWVNDKPYPGQQLKIIPKNGYATINGADFSGSVEVVMHQDRALVINHVDLEEYVYGVLKSESWPGWPVEVNKAFAIASRSYVMAMMNQGNNKLPYHVKNTKAHQTYNGMHASMTLRTAVEQTRGMFLSHNNEPALAMFDCCCGGIIPAYIDDFDFQKTPYLARTYPCTHCKRCKIYSWKKEFSVAELGKKIAHLVDGSAQQLALQDVKIGKKDKAGLVHELLIKHNDRQKKISGKQFYAALKDIKSFSYSLSRKKDRLIFSGNGYGHHLGICQWGAREMVKDGWPYTRILSFYYPGTKLTKLT